MFKKKKIYFRKRAHFQGRTNIESEGEKEDLNIKFKRKKTILKRQR